MARSRRAGRVGVQRRSASRTWERDVDRFLRWKRAETAVGDDWLRRMRWELLRFPRLAAAPGTIQSPTRPRDVTVDHVAELRRAVKWERATFALHFAALRQFLVWSGNPLARRRSVWSLPGGVSTHRRWLTKPQFSALFRGAAPAAQLLVGLEGLNGLRRVEVLRLRARDVALSEGSLRVLGKGRHGGKWRMIPIHEAIRPALSVALAGRGEDDRLFPYSRSGLDQLLARAASDSGLTGAGVRVSHHDLRRTFGRMAHQAGMDLVQLKNLYGHQSLEQTVHYIGLDAEEMRRGLHRLTLTLSRPDRAPSQSPTLGGPRLRPL